MATQRESGIRLTADTRPILEGLRKAGEAIKGLRGLGEIAATASVLPESYKSRARQIEIEAIERGISAAYDARG